MKREFKRREFLKTAGIGLAGSAVAAPAIAQSAPELKWRLTASWPKSLDTLYGGCEYFSKRIAEITDNKFQIQVFAAGEIVPGLQVLDAVQNGTVEMGNTALYYYWGKDPAFTYGTALPFGLNARQMNSWFRFGGGHELMNELLAKYNCFGTIAANTGAQMGGWFRKEIMHLDRRRIAHQQRPARRPHARIERGLERDFRADPGRVSRCNGDARQRHGVRLPWTAKPPIMGRPRHNKRPRTRRHDVA